ncbi:hypothetical protein [uncultured Aquimarina sp.]|uniref:DoxX family protein n=1 Tax=uncultured Aquimarina sp. TaxID=575652 RepID=UPI00261B08B0|nr:hypothetical protein [uncultured Aquimarina sp.]
MKNILKLLILVAIFYQYQLSAQTKNISRNWTSFSQSVVVTADSTKKFKVIAKVKVETDGEKTWAGIWARVDNKADQGRGFFDNMRNRPIKSDTWNTYTVQGVIDAKSEKLVFGGICTHNGKFFYDKFEVYIEDDAGEFQPVPIDNASFETQVTTTSFPGWTSGISGAKILVREFSFTSTQDRVDGDYALLVEGKGISENTGSIEGVFPNIGMVIAIFFILLLLFSLMTYTSSTEDEQWSIWGRVGFRFSCIYFLFFIFFYNNGAYPFFEELVKIPIDLMQQFVPWFGEDIVGIPYRVNTGPNGSGDTSYEYLLVFVIFMFAVLGTLIWSLLDRKRPNYKKLYYWLTTAMRYYVGLMLISYGLVKVIQLQFPAPSFYRLMQPYGESSPMGLAWTFLGFSEGYNMFMGIAEVLAGLLLFRRTLTFGAVITLMTALNVMAVNYFFDVPVKLLSTHLVIMTLFLLARDIKRVMTFLVTNKAVEKLTVIQRPALKKWIHISLNALKGLIIAFALGYGFYETFKGSKLYGTERPKPALYGIYEVTNYVINGDTITHYKSDRRWKDIRFEREGSVQVTRMSKEKMRYSVEIDSTAQKIKFISSSGESDSFDLNYTKTKTTLDFNYIHKNDTIYGQTRRLDQDDFLLTNRGFHWISENPFNR